MILNVWSTSESVCLTEPLRLRRLPNINRLRSPTSWLNMFDTLSPFWHDLQWNAPMKTAMIITTTKVGRDTNNKIQKIVTSIIAAKSSVILLFVRRVVVWTIFELWCTAHCGGCRWLKYYWSRLSCNEQRLPQFKLKNIIKTVRTYSSRVRH